MTQMETIDWRGEMDGKSALGQRADEAGRGSSIRWWTVQKKLCLDSRGGG